MIDFIENDTEIASIINRWMYDFIMQINGIIIQLRELDQRLETLHLAEFRYLR